MKVSAAIVLVAATTSTGVSAYQQPSRSTLRSLGQKSVSFQGPSRNVGATMKMEGACVLFRFDESSRSFLHGVNVVVYLMLLNCAVVVADF